MRERHEMRRQRRCIDASRINRRGKLDWVRSSKGNHWQFPRLVTISRCSHSNGSMRVQQDRAILVHLPDHLAGLLIAYRVAAKTLPELLPVTIIYS